jgi:hypothetical protein
LNRNILAADHGATAPCDFELSEPLMRLRLQTPCGSGCGRVYQKETPMISIKTVVAIVVCGMLTLPAHADTISGGKVTSINADGKSFIYTKKKKHWTFRITDKTVLRQGENAGSLSDLKTGQPAKVEFQRQGASFTALLIGVGF